LLQVAVTDTQSLRRALQKPLEGVWKYKEEYTMLHGLQGRWYGSGKAIFVWKPDEHRYDVYIWASVAKEHAPSITLLTFVLEGTLAADASGLPAPRARLPFSFAGRQATEELGEQHARDMTFTEFRIMSRKNSDEVITVCARYRSGTTACDVVFERL
jgi:hypothetical protein